MHDGYSVINGLDKAIVAIKVHVMCCRLNELTKYVTHFATFVLTYTNKIGAAIGCLKL